MDYVVTSCAYRAEENGGPTGAGDNGGSSCRELPRHHEGAITCINNRYECDAGSRASSVAPLDPHSFNVCAYCSGRAGEIITCGIDKVRSGRPPFFHGRPRPIQVYNECCVPINVLSQTICLLDWREGRVVQVWRGHSKPVNRVRTLNTSVGGCLASCFRH